MKSKKIPLASCLLSFLFFFTITSFLLPYIFADDEALSEGTSTSRSGIPSHLSLSSLLRRVSKNLQYDWKQKEMRLYPTDLTASILSFRGAFLIKPLVSTNEKEKKKQDDDYEKEEDEIVSLLLAALMSDRNNIEVASMLLRIGSLVKPYFFLVSGNSQSQRLILSSSSQIHEISALYVLSSCRIYESFIKDDKKNTNDNNDNIGSDIIKDSDLLQEYIELAINGLISRITIDGLLDLKQEEKKDKTVSLVKKLLFSPLRQAETIAALRCAGVLFNKKDYFNFAEKLRRGLFSFYLSIDDQISIESPFITTIHVDKDNNEYKKRDITTQLPMLLLFLEHRDIPSQVIQEIAEVSINLLTPIGLQISINNNVLSKWKVSPIEQAIIFAGILKHMLPLSNKLNIGGNIGDEVGAGDIQSADSLSALIDGVLRIEQALVQLESESAARFSEKLRHKMSLFYKDLENESIDGINDHHITAFLRNTAKIQKRLGDTAAAAVFGKFQQSITTQFGKKKTLETQNSSSSSTRVNETNNAHLFLPLLTPSIQTLLNLSITDAYRLLNSFDSTGGSLLFTFPEFLIPVEMNDRPRSPRLVNDAVQFLSWSELKDGDSITGKAIRTQLAERLDALGEETLANNVRMTSTSKNPPLIALAPLLEEIAKGMRYPESQMGLKVVRIRDNEEEINKDLLTQTQTNEIPEQVVIEVLRHNHYQKNNQLIHDNNSNSNIDDSNLEQASTTLQETIQKDSKRHSNTLLIRGDGRPFFSSTAVAAVFFRRLFEKAFLWLKGRDELVLAERKAKKKKKKDDDDRLSSTLWLEEDIESGKTFFTFLQTKSNIPHISNRAMQAFLHSGAADASLLAVDFEWLKDPFLSKYRNIRGGEENRKTNDLPMNIQTNEKTIVKEKEKIKSESIVKKMNEKSNSIRIHLCKDTTRSKSAWYNSCCLNTVIEITNSIPTFQCLSEIGNTLQTLSCLMIEDNYCDCPIDGIDEMTTSACSFIDNKGQQDLVGFFCKSGVKNDPPRGISGNLGNSYISFSKVQDGVIDCINGEDESSKL